MDIISHGLWGGIAFGRTNKKSFWLSFLLGMGPDLLAFAPFFILILLGVVKRPNFSREPPDPNSIPHYVYQLYNFSHSLIVFALLFVILWLIFRRPIWEFCAWGLHILFDIPTHSYKFFPTPFLWPVSHFEINGHSWATREILIPDVLLLLILYAWFFLSKRKKHSQRYC
jgi:membrane-bound metal-dependent hydrolase YbcI (DUF457 family)